MGLLSNADIRVAKSSSPVTAFLLRIEVRRLCRFECEGSIRNCFRARRMVTIRMDSCPSRRFVSRLQPRGPRALGALNNRRTKKSKLKEERLARLSYDNSAKPGFR